MSALMHIHTTRYLVLHGSAVTAHVTELTTKCAQTQYALRVLRAHGLNDDALQNVFRSVVVARLL